MEEKEVKKVKKPRKKMEANRKPRFVGSGKFRRCLKCSEEFEVPEDFNQYICIRCTRVNDTKVRLNPNYFHPAKPVRHGHDPSVPKDT